MAIINTNGSFGPTDTVTNTNLNSVADAATFNDPVDETTLELITTGEDSGKLRIKANGVGTTQIAASSVTKAKIENVDNMKVLGNTSGSSAAPQEVDVIDDDTMATATDTTLATSESIKAYVDSAPNFTPSTYAGEESVTFPNGLIMKWGSLDMTASSTSTVTFATAFSTIVNVQVSWQIDNNDSTPPVRLKSPISNESIEIRNLIGGTAKVYWQAIGY